MTDKIVIDNLIPLVVPAPLDDDARARIAALAIRQHKANGVLMKATSSVARSRTG